LIHGVKLKSLSIIISLLIILLGFGCQSSTEPGKLKIPTPYVSLNVGDIRQYVEDETNIIHQLVTTDTTRRTDGQKVFKVEYIIFLPDGAIWTGTPYYFFRDNYYIGTKLDTIDEESDNLKPRNSKNKFDEQKLAQVFPIDGDSFYRSDAVADSEKVLFNVSFIDSITTPCGNFTKVAQFEMTDPTIPLKMQILYAPGYGHIGSFIERDGNKYKLFATYMKTGEKELGEYIPIYLGKKAENKKQRVNTRFNFLGQKVFLNN
jgi:hypothetical protein